MCPRIAGVGYHDPIAKILWNVVRAVKYKDHNRSTPTFLRSSPPSLRLTGVVEPDDKPSCVTRVNGGFTLAISAKKPKFAVCGAILNVTYPFSNSDTLACNAFHAVFQSPVSEKAFLSDSIYHARAESAAASESRHPPPSLIEVTRCVISYVQSGSSGSAAHGCRKAEFQLLGDSFVLVVRHVTKRCASAPLFVARSVPDDMELCNGAQLAPHFRKLDLPTPSFAVEIRRRIHYYARLFTPPMPHPGSWNHSDSTLIGKSSQASYRSSGPATHMFPSRLASVKSNSLSSDHVMWVHGRCARSGHALLCFSKDGWIGFPTATYQFSEWIGTSWLPAAAAYLIPWYQLNDNLQKSKSKRSLTFFFFLEKHSSQYVMQLWLLEKILKRNNQQKYINENQLASHPLSGNTFYLLLIRFARLPKN
eukprot:gene9793-6870_t